MLLRSKIEEINGFKYLIEKLDIQSGLARHILYDTSYMHTKEEIEKELDYIETIQKYMLDPSSNDAILAICRKLVQIKDIRGTIKRLQNRYTLDDIELFELKSFSIYIAEISLILRTNNIKTDKISDLEDVIAILDPDKTRIPQFYIYNSYSADLKTIRDKMKQLKRTPGYDESEYEELFSENILLEDRIRDGLSTRLNEYTDDIFHAIISVAHLDIIIAKARQAIHLGFCRPVISGNEFSYSGIYNPEVKEALAQNGKEFQAIDICFGNNTTLITGANMSGKTVILRTVALAQTLFQFGFFVPAASAQIPVIDDILLSIDEKQDELKGLSSFAAEMLQIDRIIKKIKNNSNILILIDEPARTTNPIEGMAIVNALIELLSMYKAPSLVTTHYSGISSAGRKLRVKGFVENDPNNKLDINNIDKYINYSLIEEDVENVPYDALRVSRLLGVDNNLLNMAEKYLSDKNDNIYAKQ